MISVIVAVYNVEEYIDECLRSIVCQTYRDLQIIVVDDGSTDKSSEICDGYSLRDERILVIHTENHGLVMARKEGLKYAKGEFVSFVDGDDYVESMMCEKLYNFSLNNKVDFVHFGMFYLKNDKYKHCPFDNKVIFLENECDRLKSLSVFLDESTLPIMAPSVVTKFFRRDVAQFYNSIPNDSSYGEDVLLRLICLLKCNSFALLCEPFYVYRIRNNSISHQNLYKNIEREIQLLKYIIDIKNEINDESVCQIINRDIIDRMKRTVYLYDDTDLIRRYYWQDMDTIHNRRVIIYGAGKVGKDFYVQFMMSGSVTITSWVDKIKNDSVYFDYTIKSPDDAITMEYDYLIIAVDDEYVAEEIKKEILSKGISSKKIIWNKPGRYF